MQLDTLLCISNNNILTMNVDNKLSSNPLTISNALNSYFLSIAENIVIKNSTINTTTDNTDPMNYLRQTFGHISSQMKLKNTSMQEINKIINSIKCKDSAGYDEISSRILKKSAPYISSPLIYIYVTKLYLLVFSQKDQNSLR